MLIVFVVAHALGKTPAEVRAMPAADVVGMAAFLQISREQEG